jgi:hypothetical protein
LLFFFALVNPAFASENPLAVANNKIGIHILDPSELPAAAQLVNSNGGDWGYVTIPIQSGDENLVKWQNFMDQCKQYHVIPIIRLATQDDYFDTQVWRTPNQYDIMDFANFLNSLEWPTKNRYIIVYNEVNRADEWGGSADPASYAKLLSFAVTVFKTFSPDFFIISAGLDNAAPDQGTTYIDEYTYLQEMNQAVPGIFNQVNGIDSHSYPNPGFSQAPDPTSLMGVGSFIHERQLIESMSSKVLPVFITETGWSSQTLSGSTIVQYYDQTFKTIWNDPDIVAITPFLLNAGAGPFAQFSFLDTSGGKTQQYQYIYNMAKVKGVPSLPTIQVLAASTSATDNTAVTKDFSKYKPFARSISLSMMMENVFDYLVNK